MPVFVRRAAWGFLFLAAMPISATAFAANPAAEQEPPRGYGYISTRTFNFFVQRSVQEQTLVQENVLGASTQGTQATKAQLTILSRPDAARGAFDLRLAGQCRCDDSVGHKGPATIHGSSSTDFDARVHVSFVDDKFVVEGVDANSQTQTQVHDVQTRNPLVERMARRRANKKVPQVEQEVSRLAEERVAARLRDEVGKMAIQVNEAIADKAKRPLSSVGAWPQMKFATTESGLSLTAFPAGPARAIETPHPADWKTNADIAVCVHESLLEHVVGQLLGGRNVSDNEILRIVELLTGTAPRSLWVHDRSERWSVVLAAKRPVEIAFHDEAIYLVANVVETVRGEERTSMPVRVSAAFEAVAHVDGLSLVRRGGLAVELTSAPENDPAAESLHKFLAAKFGGIFQEEFHFDTLAPPAGGFGEKMRHVRPESFHFQNGWASVVYLLHKTPPK